MIRSLTLVLLLLFAAGCEDESTTETGIGSVLLHIRVDVAGPANGIQAYIIRDKQSTERRVSTDANGDARFEQVPAGSWDVGFFESSDFHWGAGATRVTVDVRDDATTELTMYAKRVVRP